MRMTYSSRNPITTFATVEASIFSPLRIAQIVLQSSPVALVGFRNPLTDCGGGLHFGHFSRTTLTYTVSYV
jgi:hypothetical protein